MESKLKLEGAVHCACVKAPSFDGKMSWTNYLKQFEAAARANKWSEREKAVKLIIALRGDALDVLYFTPVEETHDFEQLGKRLNMRYHSKRIVHRNVTRAFKNSN
ncbi:unnamed protein product [Psylliodes chrysocephalus]|uniref:Uncharacterized protein n=1 Tax=Psylliodes chrysocephalus TaxID=3402493 RepID=A0A9P0CZ04_9CUCU|nr:unnamed protein product [Psylliodes chrysocephala]